MHSIQLNKGYFLVRYKRKKHKKGHDIPSQFYVYMQISLVRFLYSKNDWVPSLKDYPESNYFQTHKKSGTHMNPFMA